MKVSLFVWMLVLFCIILCAFVVVVITLRSQQSSSITPLSTVTTVPLDDDAGDTTWVAEPALISPASHQHPPSSNDGGRFVSLTNKAATFRANRITPHPNEISVEAMDAHRSALERSLASELKLDPYTKISKKDATKTQ